MDWVALITLITELIGNCRKTQKRDAVHKRVHDPGFRDWLLVRRELRKSGMKRKEVNECCNSLRAEIECCKEEGHHDECCDELIADAETGVQEAGERLA